VPFAGKGISPSPLRGTRCPCSACSRPTGRAVPGRRITARLTIDGGRQATLQRAGWPGKLYGVAQIDDGGWEKLVPKFIAAGFDMDLMERRPRRSRGPGPETATVALNVRSYSEHERRALLAHRHQIPPESFLVSLSPELRRLAFTTACFVRLYPLPAPRGSTSRIF